VNVPAFGVDINVGIVVNVELRTPPLDTVDIDELVLLKLATTPSLVSDVEGSSIVVGAKFVDDSAIVGRLLFESCHMKVIC